MDKLHEECGVFYSGFCTACFGGGYPAAVPGVEMKISERKT